MADWRAIEGRIADAVSTTFGEPVTLPSGIVTGIFSRLGTPSSVDLTDITGVRFGQQPNPTLELLAADAVGLLENDLVTARETDYRVVRIDPDNSGLVRIELMPEITTDIPDEQRWQ